MKKLFITVFTLLLFGILLFLLKPDEQNLGDHYYYLLKDEADDIGYPGGAIIYKSDQKNVFSDVKISGDVTSVYSDNDHILAIREPNFFYSKNLQKKFPQQDSLRFFILDKKIDKVYSFYKKEDFFKMREKLGVSKTLDFKEE